MGERAALLAWVSHAFTAGRWIQLWSSGVECCCRNGSLVRLCPTPPAPTRRQGNSARSRESGRRHPVPFLYGEDWSPAGSSLPSVQVSELGSELVSSLLLPRADRGGGTWVKTNGWDLGCSGLKSSENEEAVWSLLLELRPSYLVSEARPLSLHLVQ